jgi:ATP-dependent protease ClpP protease subunit
MNARTTLLGSRRLLRRPPIVPGCEGDIDDETLAAFTADFTRAVASGQSVVPYTVHSDGGELTTALKMVALIQSCPVPTISVCTSQAASAAVLVFAAANTRWLGPQAVLMLHQASLCSVSGTAREIAVESRELVRMNDASCRVLAACSGKPEAFFVDLLASADGDVYLTAPQALGHGLATRVGVPHLETRIAVTLNVVGPWTRSGPGETLVDVGAAGGGGGGGARPTKRRRRRGGGGGGDSDDSDDSDEE